MMCTKMNKGNSWGNEKSTGNRQVLTSRGIGKDKYVCRTVSSSRKDLKPHSFFYTFLIYQDDLFRLEVKAKRELLTFCCTEATAQYSPKNSLAKRHTNGRNLGESLSLIIC